MKRYAKTALAAVGLALALLVSAGPARADNGQDIQFLALLQHGGIQSNALGIPMGHAVCADVDALRVNGAAAVDALLTESQRVYNVTDASMTADLSMWFVSAAVAVYCPWNNVYANTYA